MRKKPLPTIEELAIEVHEAERHVHEAAKDHANARAELRKRLCVAAGRGNYEHGRVFLLDLLKE